MKIEDRSGEEEKNGKENKNVQGTDGRTHKNFTAGGRLLKKKFKFPLMEFPEAESVAKFRSPEKELEKDPVRPLLSRIKEVTETPLQTTPAQA